MNNKVRVMVVEAEGSDEAVASILKALHSQAGFASPQVAAVEQPREIEPAAPKVAELPPVSERRAKPARAKPAHKPARAKPAHKPAKATVQATPSADSGGAESRHIVIEALRKRPMTSGDLIKQTGLKGSTVYSMLDYLKKRGTVEAREVDGSMFKQYFLIAG